jgi:D-lactate dehydrogenase (cytochrome)
MSGVIRRGLPLFKANSRLCTKSSTLQARMMRFANSSSSATTRSVSLLSSRNLLTLSVASLISGCVGFYLATRDTEDTSKSPIVLSSKYASPRECAQAIAELEKTFSDDADAVSTNPDDVAAHGFSSNDYHPGKYFYYGLSVSK